MSTEFKKQLTDIGSYIFKGTVASLFALAVFIFNDMRSSVDELHDDVKAISKDMRDISNIVGRLDEKVDGAKSDIERLDRTKADKK